MNSIMEKKHTAEYGVSIIYSVVLIVITCMVYLGYSKNLTGISWEIQVILFGLACLVGIRLIMFHERWNWFGVMMAVIGVAAAGILLADAHS